MSGNLPEVMEVSGNKSCRAKLFIANFKFGTTPVFTRLLHAALRWLIRILLFVKSSQTFV